MTKLFAKERFYYNGRNLVAGEEFEAIEQDVPLLTHSVSPRATVGPPDTGAAKPRRRYSRRDMLAED